MKINYIGAKLSKAKKNNKAKMKIIRPIQDNRPSPPLALVRLELPIGPVAIITPTTKRPINTIAIIIRLYPSSNILKLMPTKTTK